MSTRSPIDAWWDRTVEQGRVALRKQRDLPHDGASWVCYVNFFGMVGLADPQIKVEYVNPVPVVNKLVELWNERKRKDKALDELTRLTEEVGGYVEESEVQDGK